MFTSANIFKPINIFILFSFVSFVVFLIALNALFMYKEFLLIVILIFMLIDPIPVTGGPSAGCGK